VGTLSPSRQNPWWSLDYGAGHLGTLFCANILLPFKIFRFLFPLAKTLYFMLGTDPQERLFLGLKLSEKKFRGGVNLAREYIYYILSVESPNALWDASMGFVLRRTKFPDLQCCIFGFESRPVSFHPPMHPMFPTSNCTEFYGRQSLWHVFLQRFKGHF
jgi:hypothetical protein